MSDMENSKLILEKPLPSLKETVCGFCSDGVITPYFSQNVTGDAVTVNGDRYRTMIRITLKVWIQQSTICSSSLGGATLRHLIISCGTF